MDVGKFLNRIFAKKPANNAAVNAEKKVLHKSIAENFKEKRHQEVIKLAESIDIENLRSNTKSLNFYCQALVQSNAAQKADEIFKAAFEANRENETLKHQYAYYLSKRQNFSEAHSLTHELLKAKPQEAKYHKLAKDTSWYLGSYEESMAHFKAAGLNENDLSYKNRLCDTHVMQHKYESAKPLAEDLSKANPDNASLEQRNSQITSCISVKSNSSYMKSPVNLSNSKRQEAFDHLRNYGWARISIQDFYGDEKGEQLWQKAKQQMSEIRNLPHVDKLYSQIENNDPSLKERGFKPDLITEKDCLSRYMSCNDSVAQVYLQEEMIEFTESYLESDIRPQNGAIWIRPKGAGKRNRRGSQIWHRDQEDSNILKCFLYFTNVDEGSGAMDYVPNSRPLMDEKHSRVWGFPMSTGYPGDYKMSLIPKEDRVIAEGKVADLYFVDTAGFHRGGYTVTGERIVTQCTFLRKDSFYVKKQRGFEFEKEGIEHLSEKAQKALQ